MRAKCPFDFFPIDDRGTSPAFRSIEHDHRPSRARSEAVRPRIVLDAPDLQQNLIQRSGHQLMHDGGIVALDEVRIIAKAAEHVAQL